MLYRLTRRRTDGGLSHEFRCSRNGHGCNRRATFRVGDDGEMIRAKGGARARISRELAREIYTSPLSARRAADLLGVSASTVKDIRIGRLHKQHTADLRGAEVVERVQNYCNECIHYDNGCTLGFPEAKSPAYASMCSVFQIDQGWDPNTFTLKEFTWQNHDLHSVA